MQPSAPCETARRAIERRNFIGWRGLPEGCGARELFAALPPLPEAPEDRPVRPLGEDFRPATFQLLQLPGYYRPTVSFRDDRPVLFDAMNPELAGDLRALLADLGAPAARLDWSDGTLGIPGGEWVFPSRGITLFLGAAFDRVLHVALYHPVTLKQYRSALRPHLRKRPLPGAPH